MYGVFPIFDWQMAFKEETSDTWTFGLEENPKGEFLILKTSLPKVHNE